MDRTEDWTEKFSHLTIARISWRTVKINTAVQRIILTVTVAESGIFYAESAASLSSDVDMLVKRSASIKGKQTVQ